MQRHGEQLVLAAAVAVAMVLAVVPPVGAEEVLGTLDLGITKDVSLSEARPGDPLQYTLVATNHNELGAPKGVVKDTLPAGVTFVAATADRGSCSFGSGVVTCEYTEWPPTRLDPVAGVWHISIDVVIDDDATGTLVNTANVASVGTAAYGPPDVNPENDIATAATRIIVDPEPGSIGDLVWDDLDADGVHDAGEPGLAGVTVTLTGPSGPATTVTDANGSYGFDGLVPGDYTTAVETASLPTGYVMTTPSSVTHALLEGEAYVDADFGASVPPVELGAIGDFVCDDADGDGLVDPGEAGVAGVTISLTGPSGPATTVSDADGLYRFDDLTAGEYTVSVDVSTLPDRYVLTTPATITYSLGQGEIYTLADFGAWYQAPEPGTIGDLVWHDADGDGVHETGELGLAGISVGLTGPSGPATAVTDADGKYLFADLAVGDYTVTLDVSTLPTGYVLTTPGAVTHTLGEGEDYLGADFGAWIAPQPVIDLSITKTVSTSPVEEGTKGIVFTVTVSNAGPDDATGVVVTESFPAGLTFVVATGDGSYLGGTWTVGTLAAGTSKALQITADAPKFGQYVNAAEVTAADQADVNSTPGDKTGDDYAEVTLKVSKVEALANIGDTVFEDKNLNKKQDSGEPGISGVKVSLSGPVSRTATTNASGKYLFDNLADGTYTVSVSKSGAGAGYGLTTPSSYKVVLDGVDYLAADFGFAEELPATGMDARLLSSIGALLLLLGAGVLARYRSSMLDEN